MCLWGEICEQTSIEIHYRGVHVDGLIWLAKLSRLRATTRPRLLFTTLVTGFAATLAATLATTPVATHAALRFASLPASFPATTAATFVRTHASTLAALLALLIPTTLSVVLIVDLAKTGDRCLLWQRLRHAAARSATNHGRCNKMHAVDAVPKSMVIRTSLTKLPRLVTIYYILYL